MALTAALILPLAEPAQAATGRSLSQAISSRAISTTGLAAAAKARQQVSHQRYAAYLKKVRRQWKLAEKAVAYARRQLGKRYQWAAAGPNSFDCSGLTMRAWGAAGVELPHMAVLQYSGTRRKVPVKSLKPGDLITFYGFGHVALYIGKGRFIHAPGTGRRVSIGRMDAWHRRAVSGAARPGAPRYLRPPKGWDAKTKAPPGR
ncbi:hypothetical protein GCM10027589_17580 [Actinocorallia lasiicapitis]